MSKPKQTNDGRASLSVGAISNVGRDVNIAGGDLTMEQTTVEVGAGEIGELFDRVYNRIEARPRTSAAGRKGLKAKVRQVQAAAAAAAHKPEKLDEGFLLSRFRNLARMAPDILDVVVSTLASPALGLGTIAKKIAAKAKEQVAG